MSRHVWRAPLLILLIAAGLAACSPALQTCETDALVAPELEAPSDGAVVNAARPALSWSYPGDCAPRGYHVDLSATFDFSDASLAGGTGDASTAWAPAEDLADCTVYFWRVAGMDESSLGPASGSRAFTTDFTGSCASATIPAASTGSIHGVVWHDLCAVPFETTSIPPEGCVAAETEGAFRANGVLEPGEPGIGGVQVALGEGLCPSAGSPSPPGVATATSGTDGAYDFTGLAAGTYCLTVDAGIEPNTSVLIPGDWTGPALGDGSGVMRVPVTIGEGEGAEGLDFGWDYQFLPALPSPVPPTVTPTPAVGSIGGLIWNDVCHYTGGAGGEPLVLGDGCVGNPEGEWGANGVVDRDEDPLSRVTFRLGAGSCLAPAFYASTDSNSAGYFLFINLPPGVYCLSLDPLTDGNDRLLIPGGPSNWPTVGGVLLITIELGPGEDRVDIRIGWEWQHLG